MPVPSGADPDQETGLESPRDPPSDTMPVHSGTLSDMDHVNDQGQVIEESGNAPQNNVPQRNQRQNADIDELRAVIEDMKKHCEVLSGENAILKGKFSDIEQRYFNVLLRDDNKTALIGELKAAIADLLRDIIDMKRQYEGLPDLGMLALVAKYEALMN